MRHTFRITLGFLLVIIGLIGGLIPIFRDGFLGFLADILLILSSSKKGVGLGKVKVRK